VIDLYLQFCFLLDSINVVWILSICVNIENNVIFKKGGRGICLSYVALFFISFVYYTRFFYYGENDEI